MVSLLPCVAVKSSDLTKGERLIVERRRDENSQQEAADWYGVSLYRYRQWERDSGSDIPSRTVGRLKPHEVCFILRRRSGMALGELARLLGVSREWAARLECGKVSVDRLVDFWNKQAA